MADKLAALVVCPGRGSYGKAELGYLKRLHADKSELIAAFDRLRAERAPGRRVARVAAEDSFIPLARAATLTLPSRDSIVAAALDLTGGRDPTKKERRRG